MTDWDVEEVYEVMEEWTNGGFDWWIDGICEEETWTIERSKSGMEMGRTKEPLEDGKEEKSDGKALGTKKLTYWAGNICHEK